MVRHAAAAIALVFTLSPSWLSAQSTTFTVTTESASIHKAPSTGSAVIGHVARGRMLPVTRELGSWVQVSWPEADNGAGYLNLSWGTLGNRSTAADPTRSAATTSPRPATSAGTAPVTAAQAAQARAVEPGAALRPVYAPPASHALGLGARMGNSPMGFGVGARAWRRKGFGAQVDVSRYALDSAVTAQHLTSFEIEPSVTFALADKVGDYLWVRPYVGSGVMIQRQSLNNGQPGAVNTTSNGWGWQAFAGGEMTFAGAPQFAVSADVGYRRLNTPVEGFDLGGVGLSVSAHWYVK
jgi:hypothetical protein